MTKQNPQNSGVTVEIEHHVMASNSRDMSKIMVIKRTKSKKAFCNKQIKLAYQFSAVVTNLTYIAQLNMTSSYQYTYMLLVGVRPQMYSHEPLEVTLTDLRGDSCSMACTLLSCNMYLIPYHSRLMFTFSYWYIYMSLVRIGAQRYSHRSLEVTSTDLRGDSVA